MQRETRVTQVTPAHPVAPVTLDSLERMVRLESPVTQVTKGTADITGVLDETGPQEHPEPRETLHKCTAHLETRDPLETVFPETRAQLDLQDVLEHPELVETRGRWLR